MRAETAPISASKKTFFRGRTFFCLCGKGHRNALDEKRIFRSAAFPVVVEQLDVIAEHQFDPRKAAETEPGRNSGIFFGVLARERVRFRVQSVLGEAADSHGDFAFTVLFRHAVARTISLPLRIYQYRIENKGVVRKAFDKYLYSVRLGKIPFDG